MNREFLVALLQKDIQELKLLTEGFESMTQFPEPILQLAIQKAENVVKYLNLLTTYKLSTDLNPDENVDSAPQPAEKIPEVHLPEREIDVNQSKNVSAEVSREEELLTKDEEFDEEMEVDEIEEDDQIPIFGMQSEEILNKKGETVKEPEKSDNPVQHVPSLNESLYRPEVNSLGETLANKKIDDIRNAITIGDRFRFQRELFNGNGEVMNKTIAYLNQLSKFEEAESFLRLKFHWKEDNPHVEDFLQIVRRRYL